ncbi:antiviral innate immune response receptor RIG-I-like isoform X2 [Ruditapes philippinarum]|uniref:antiviral innate immune response receptor RIG-I-like isoform X2 n=1 Tax=Ruditapes philippinarum TaxID=129788 RepID=UPI00295BB017|nr:antiviral innate immune response receptor RIG-I-like isoform X2 [Ruditapes philippinarum]
MRKQNDNFQIDIPWKVGKGRRPDKMEVEERLLFYSQEITRCIKEPSVISHLEADSIIPSDDCSKIKKIFIDADPFKANEMMIDCLMKSSAQGKWKSLLTALEKSEYVYIKSLLETEGKPSMKDEREKAIIRVFISYLEKNIDAMDIVAELFSRKVINDTDAELIRAQYHNKGNTYATIVLLDRMQCRLAPGEWFYQFLDVLVQKNLKHIVKEIEPDFLQYPERFGSSHESVEKCIDCDKKDMAVEACEMKLPVSIKSGDIQEHVLTEYSSVATDMASHCMVSEIDMNDCKSSSSSSDYEDALEEIDEHVYTPHALEGDDIESHTNEAKDTCISLDRFALNSCSENTDRIETSQDDITELNATIQLGERAPPEGRNFEPDVTAEITTQNDTDVQNDEIPLTEELTSETEESDDFSDDETTESKSFEEKLYPFQHELAGKALAGENTIIVAPTGSGKTWVATHIIDRHLNMPTEGGKKRRVVFMARNGILVEQQKNFISKRLPYANVQHLKGDTDEAMMLNAFLEDYDIFLFTPQILVNNLNKDVKSLSVFSLMVFDECHHTIRNQPYNTLMKKYLLEKSNGIKNLPQIIGLTASIGTGRAKSEQDALEHIFNVCASLDVRDLSTVEKHKDDLAKHVSIPKEDKIPMQARQTDQCKSILLVALKKTLDFLEDLAWTEPNLIEIMHKCPKNIEEKEFGKWISDISKAAESLRRGRGRNVVSCGKYLQIYNNALEINRLLRTTDVALYLARQHEEEAEHPETFTKEESCLFETLKEVQKDLRKVKSDNPNVHVVSSILSNLFAGKEADANSRAMVFVQTRATCRALAAFLNEELKSIYVKVSPLIGKDTRGIDKGMTEEDQTRIIDEFKEGDFKVLVATSVGMEGLDVPDCNMTLNYNFNANEITKIQMSGRSRKAKGTAVMIATDTQFDKDRVVMYRVKLMAWAVAFFNNLDAKSIERRILTAQKKIIDDYKWHLQTMELSYNRKSDVNDYEIHCKKCGKHICNTSNLRKLDTSYIVAMQGFEQKIRRVEHERSVSMGLLKKICRMFCTHCSKAWGVIAIKGDLEFYILKLENLKFICENSNEYQTYKNWSSMPYKVTEIRNCDLERLYKQNE